MSCVFSVIVPCYNVAPWLEATLTSVFEQTFKDWECLCIDDGSTDGTSAMLDEWAQKDVRFRVFHQANGGEGAARNTALQSSKGDWILFLDADDILHPRTMEILIGYFDPDISVVRFGYCRFKNETKSVLSLTDNDGFRDVDISQTVPMGVIHAYVWQHTYRRAILEGISFMNYRRGADRVYLAEVLLSRANTIRMVSHELYGYRVRKGSAIQSPPSFQVLLDEMDHRIDIIHMIDASRKIVNYSGNGWLEGYFIQSFPTIVSRSNNSTREDLAKAWHERMRVLRMAKGISRCGHTIAKIASSEFFYPLVFDFCCVFQRFRFAIGFAIGRIHTWMKSL